METTFDETVKISNKKEIFLSFLLLHLEPIVLETILSHKKKQHHLGQVILTIIS